MTLWSPDTCDCQVEYTDDGQFTVTTHKACKYHDTPDKVFAENQMKNKVLSDVKAKTGKDHAWSFDEGRNIVVQVDPEDRAKVAEILITHPGAKLA